MDEFSNADFVSPFRNGNLCIFTYDAVFKTFDPQKKCFRILEFPSLDPHSDAVSYTHLTLPTTPYV